jgi:large subunit ribosomal protein L32
MRHTSGHTRNRRSHHALKVARFETCKDCNAKHLMHRMCTNCGKYRGRVVVDVLKKANKKAQASEMPKEKAVKAKPALKVAKTEKADKEKKEKKQKKEKVVAK